MTGILKRGSLAKDMHIGSTQCDDEMEVYKPRNAKVVSKPPE